jgi:hypothetical protein
MVDALLLLSVTSVKNTPFLHGVPCEYIHWDLLGNRQKG